MNQKTIERAAELLREQEGQIYRERATSDTLPIEETEAFKLAEELEEMIDDA